MLIKNWSILGYSRKYPPPHGRNLIWYLKISAFPRRTTAVFAGFQSLLIQNLEEFQNFAKIWMVFLEFWLKFIKFWGNLWISSHTHWAFFTEFPMSSIRGEGVRIFSGIAHCCFQVKYIWSNRDKDILQVTMTFIKTSIFLTIFKVRVKLCCSFQHGWLWSHMQNFLKNRFKC